MAEFMVTIPDQEVQRVTIALCSDFSIGFNVASTGEVTPEHARQVIIDLIQRIVVLVETEAAAAAIIAPTLT